jgi:hypothetical protein
LPGLAWFFPNALAIDALLSVLARDIAVAAVMGIYGGVDAEVVARLQAIDLCTAAIDGTDFHARGVATALPIFWATWIAGAARIGAYAPITALPHAARAGTAARFQVELHAAAARLARALTLAGALVEMEA